jgi:thioredoxin reductase (NADPH)
VIASKVLIVGAGPAGLAAAVQLKRYGLDPLVFEGAQAGGLLRNANWIENYPGFPRGIAGPRLAQLIVSQARQAGVAIRHEQILHLSWDGAVFQAVTLQGQYTSRLAVVASGTQPRRFQEFEIPGDLADRVFYEIYSLLGLESQQVVIVGAGDAAFDYALNLSRKNQVIIFNRGEQVKCLPLLWERAKACSRITYLPGVRISRLASSPQGGIMVECSSPTGVLQFQAQALLGAIGREPQEDFLDPAMQAHRKSLETQGILHFIGDVKNGIYRQAAIAVGDGIRAAMRIYQVMMEASK